MKTARPLIKEQTERIAALEAESASVAKSYDSAQREIESLRTANAALERAINLHEQAIGILTKAKQDADRRAAKANKRSIIATVIAVASVARIFL